MNNENCLSCVLKAIVALQNNASKIDVKYLSKMYKDKKNSEDDDIDE